MFRRVRSFTIIEMIMAMLISSVVIGMAYYIFRLLNHQFGGYRARSSVISEYLIFQKAIQADMDRADAVALPEDNALVMRLSADAQPVQYDFYNNFIVRTVAENRDTFRLQNSGCLVSRVSDSSSLVEKLIVKTNIAGEPVTPVFEKQYSACQLMKLTNNE